MQMTIHLYKTGERVGVAPASMTKAIQIATDNAGPEGAFRAGDIDGLTEVFTSITADDTVYAE